MGTLRFPFLKDAAPGLLPVGSAVMKIAVTALSVEQWWAALPWLEIAAAGLIFWAGIFYSDLLNSQSQLRRWWRKPRSFEVLSVGRNRTDIENNECLEIFCVIKFLRNLSNPILTVKIAQLLPTEKTRTTVVHQERLGEIVKDKSMRLRLGTVSKTMPGAKVAYHSIWGAEQPTAELKHGQLPIVGGNQEVVEISVNGKAYRILAQPIMNLDLRVILNTEDDRLVRALT